MKRWWILVPILFSAMILGCTAETEPSGQSATAPQEEKDGQTPSTNGDGADGVEKPNLQPENKPEQLAVPQTAEKPDIKLVEVEFTVGNVRYKMHVPEGTKPANDLFVKLIGGAGFAIKIDVGYSNPPLEDQRMQSENGAVLVDGPEQFLLQIDVGNQFFMFGAQRTIGKVDFSFEPVLLRNDEIVRYSADQMKAMLYCVSTMRRAVPLPENPIEALKEYEVAIDELGDGSLEVDTATSLATDSTMELLGQLAKISRLTLDGSAITDLGMRHLAALSGVRSLTFHETEVTDEGLAHFKAYKELKELSFGVLFPITVGITGTGIRYFEGCTNLEVLHARDSQLTDAALKELHHFPKLTSVVVGRERFARKVGRISDEGVESLRGLKHIKRLDLHRVSISEKSLEVIAGFKKLNELDIGENMIEQGAIARLAQLKNLERLNLDAIQVTADTLKSLTSLGKLRELSLRDISLNATCVDALSSMKLTRLDLRGVKVQEADVLKLMQKLQGCEILVDMNN